MDFYKYKCPVCNKQFKEGDDIVVCPECGTPHHRECYEQEEHCFYQDKHSQNFSFENNLQNLRSSKRQYFVLLRTLRSASVKRQSTQE